MNFDRKGMQRKYPKSESETLEIVEKKFFLGNCQKKIWVARYDGGSVGALQTNLFLISA